MTISYTTGPEGLTFTADADSMAELIAHADNYQKQFALVLDDVTGNGLETIAPEDIGALTSSEIFGEDVETDAHGKLISVGAVYWFPNYQIINPWDTLAETGTVTFTKAED